MSMQRRQAKARDVPLPSASTTFSFPFPFLSLCPRRRALGKRHEKAEEERGLLLFVVRWALPLPRELSLSLSLTASAPTPRFSQRQARTNLPRAAGDNNSSSGSGSDSDSDSQRACWYHCPAQRTGREASFALRLWRAKRAGRGTPTPLVYCRRPRCNV